MYTLKRITDVPNSPLRILVDAPAADSPDAGFTVGGTFYFEPAGQEGDTATVGEHAARAIMGDAGLSPHFECTPPWAPEKPAKAEKKVMMPGPDLKR